jgi:hypothetical protein
MPCCIYNVHDTGVSQTVIALHQQLANKFSFRLEKKNGSEKTKKDLELLNLLNAVYIGCRTVNENDRCDKGEGYPPCILKQKVREHLFICPTGTISKTIP